MKPFLLLIALELIVVASIFVEKIHCGNKVTVTRTVKKTIRRIPAGGAASEHHSVKTSRYVRGEDGEMIEVDGSADGGASQISEASGSSSYSSSPSTGGKKSSKTVVLRDEAVDSSSLQRSGLGKQKLLRDEFGSQTKKKLGPDFEIEEENSEDAQQQTSQSNKRRGSVQSAGAGSKGAGDDFEMELEDEQWHERIWNDDHGLSHCGSGDWHQYNAYCYKLLTGSFTWDEAQAACRKEKSNLVSIHSKVENDFVAALSSHFDQNFNNFCNGFWIGMTRKEIPGMGRFQSAWVDKTKVTFGDVPKADRFHIPPFRGGQPDSPQHGVEECILMYPKLGCDSKDQIYYGQWNDFHCGASLHGAVCKKRGRLATPSKGK